MPEGTPDHSPIPPHIVKLLKSQPQGVHDPRPTGENATPVDPWDPNIKPARGGKLKMWLGKMFSNLLSQRPRKRIKEQPGPMIPDTDGYIPQPDAMPTDPWAEKIAEESKGEQ